MSAAHRKQASATALVVPVSKNETGYPLMQSYFFLKRQTEIQSLWDNAKIGIRKAWKHSSYL